MSACPKKNSRKRNNQGINELSAAELNKAGYPAIWDTGTVDNFMAEETVKRIQGSRIRLNRPIPRFAVDDRPIRFEEKLKVGFVVKGKEQEAEFYIIPGMKRHKILLGKRWIRGHLKESVPTYECGIPTKEGAMSWRRPTPCRNGWREKRRRQ